MRPRAVPADFAETVARLSTVSHVQNHYACGSTTLARWFKDSGIAPPEKIMPVPADMAELAKHNSMRAMARHYGVCEKTVRRWCERVGVKAARTTTRLRPPPPTLAKLAPTMNKLELMIHFGISQYKTLDRMLDEVGAKAKVHVRTPRPRATVDLRPGGGRGMNYAAIRTTSIFDEAADELRRNGWPVHRCDERGVYDDKGEFWRAGTLRLTPDELLARADRYRAKAA